MPRGEAAKPIAVRVPPDLLERFDKRWREIGFKDRTEAILASMERFAPGPRVRAPKTLPPGALERQARLNKGRGA